mgnify:CR=1 FL=1
MTSFIRENIKKKPFYKRKWFIRITGGVCIGGVFGAAAAVGFSIAIPWAQKTFGTPEVYSAGREISTEMIDSGTGGTESKIIWQGDSLDDINLKEIEVLFTKIRDMAAETLKGVVQVTGAHSGIDLFQQIYENEKIGSGLIVKMDEEHIFVLTEMWILDKAERVIVTLADDTICEAEVKKTDPASGLAVLEIDADEIGEEQKKEMKVLQLSSDGNLWKGKPVLALGSPLGNTDSVASGIVTSWMDQPVMDDINTDIIGGDEASGILVDLNGEVAGFITQKFGDDEPYRTRAICSSDIKRILNEMADREEKILMGITGKEIKENVAEELEMPQGFYVMSVAPDSPAMYNGIQNGDIIVSMKNEKISSQKDYQNVLKQCTIGEEIPVEIMRKVRDGYSKMEMKVRLEAK